MKQESKTRKAKTLEKGIKETGFLETTQFPNRLFLLSLFMAVVRNENRQSRQKPFSSPSSKIKKGKQRKLPTCYLLFSLVFSSAIPVPCVILEKVGQVGLGFGGNLLKCHGFLRFCGQGSWNRLHEILLFGKFRESGNFFEFGGFTECGWVENIFAMDTIL